MQASSRKNAATEALVGLWTVVLTAFVIATLFFARDILIPIALAALLTFLLSPAVSWIGRWIGRIAAVLLVVMLIFGATGLGGWVLTHQLADLATKLPQYRDNISVKLRSIRTPSNPAFAQLSDMLKQFQKDLPGGGSTGQPEISQEAGNPESASVSPPAAKHPMPVEIVDTTKANPIELVKLMIAPLLGPLGTAALVFVLVIAMLLDREDLRNRLIRLIGQGNISTTTRALEDASHRVSRYLLMQLLINVTFGSLIAIGLGLIGLPNAMLWGACAAVLRFIPYIGPWIAAVLPTTLALAISPHWSMPAMTLGIIACLELVLSNIVEPLLYGAHTGVSSIALIVAAVFWTWLWGPIGLVLTTPLTVCLVVMGRHVPRLAFLSIVLGDEQALTPAEECYQRLLALDLNEASSLAEAYIKSHSVVSLYDSVLIPVITTAEVDHRNDSLDEEQRAQVEQGIRDLVEDIGTRPESHTEAMADKAEIASAAEKTDGEVPPVSETPPVKQGRVYCLPARADRDELAGAMLAQILQKSGFETMNASARLVTGELIEIVEKSEVPIVCISVVAPSTVIHARYLATKLRARFEKLRIVIGLWGASENLPDASKRLRDSGSDEIVTTLADAVAQITMLSHCA